MLLYILQSLSKKDTFYLGITSRKNERLEEHNRGQTTSTAPNKPWIVIYTEYHDTRSGAMKRERHLKSIKGYKERLQIIAKYKK